MYFRMATLTWRDNSHQQRLLCVVTPTASNHQSHLLYLQIGRLRLIDDKPHQDVELLVEWKGLPDKQRPMFSCNQEFRSGKCV